MPRRWGRRVDVDDHVDAARPARRTFWTTSRIITLLRDVTRPKAVKTSATKQPAAGARPARRAAAADPVVELQGNGYNLAAIKDLVTRTSGSSLRTPFEDERPEVIDAAELNQRFGRDADPKLLARAETLGIIVPLGEGRFEIPSPTLLRAGESLMGSGDPAGAGVRRDRERPRPRRRRRPRPS